jgi:hypothetical protein
MVRTEVLKNWEALQKKARSAPPVPPPSEATADAPPDSAGAAATSTATSTAALNAQINANNGGIRMQRVQDGVAQGVKAASPSGLEPSRSPSDSQARPSANATRQATGTQPQPSIGKQPLGTPASLTKQPLGTPASQQQQPAIAKQALGAPPALPTKQPLGTPASMIKQPLGAQVPITKQPLGVPQALPTKTVLGATQAPSTKQLPTQTVSTKQLLPPSTEAEPAGLEGGDKGKQRKKANGAGDKGGKGPGDVVLKERVNIQSVYCYVTMRQLVRFVFQIM